MRIYSTSDITYQLFTALTTVELDHLSEQQNNPCVVFVKAVPQLKWVLTINLWIKAFNLAAAKLNDFSVTLKKYLFLNSTLQLIFQKCLDLIFLPLFSFQELFFKIISTIWMFASALKALMHFFTPVLTFLSLVFGRQTILIWAQLRLFALI